ncbi:response regulator [Desulfopila inferna]|uniref:response regulator n=1 Tax=Desulfopila inferna TaxID=468528 RepID=UPI0019635361|nr:response regulator [Desulfopila inferna]MBM9603776.1 response regulator [Desulfopila inferna]
MKKQPIRIMVVEDEILVGIMIAKKLRAFGYDVRDVITSGEEAIDQAGYDQPQVILMDVTLSGSINGLQAARQIKVKYNIPIILFSGYNKEDLAKEAEKIEPVAIVSKMGSIAELQAAIEKAVAG